MIEYFQSPTLNIVSTLFIILILLLLLFFVSDFFKLIPIFRKYLVYLKNYMFIVFLIPAMSFLFIDFAFVEFKNIPNYEFIKNLCEILFSAGIFTTTLNFLDSLNVFKKNFKSIIMSEEFDNLLTQKIDALAYSEVHLNKQSNLDKIWQTVTLCKYEQRFPQLKESIREKIENDLFHENNLSYYYKNFRTQINYELITDNIVKITEISNFTIVSNSVDSIIMDFWISTDDVESSEERKIYTKYIPEKCKMDGVQLEIIEVNNNQSNSIKLFKTYNAELKGKREYEIERSIEMTQNLENDRVFSFTSNRIIDGFTIKLNPCEKLNIFFSSVGKNKFILDNQIHDGQSYISRGVLLPGEKFQTFIYKK